MNNFEYKVRFHLQRGDHYMHWQIKAWDGSVSYVNPEYYQIEMYGCKLVNKLSTARRINDAGRKEVSGWIECDSFYVNVKDSIPIDNLEKVSYNPIKDVHWRRDGDDGTFDWDNTSYNSMVTSGRQVYILCEEEVLV